MAEHPNAWQTDDPDNPGAKLDWIRVPVTKASTKAKEEYIDICLNKLDTATYYEMLFKGLKAVINQGATDIPGDKSESSRKMAKEQAERQLEKVYEGKIRITGGRSKTGDSQEVMILARQKAVKKLKAQAKREGKVKVSLVAASTWTKLAKQLLESEHGAAIIAEAREEVAAYEKTTVGIDLSGIKEDDKLVEAATKRKKERTKATADVEGLVASVQMQAKNAPKGAARH